MQTLIGYPQLFLFAYQLRQPDTAAYKSWLAELSDLCQRLQIPSEAKYHQNRDYYFQTDKLEGIYNCQDFGDTDNLFIGCSFLHQKPADVNCLQQFKTKLDLKANIGKVWLILGNLDFPNSAAPETLAQTIYQTFNQTKNTINLQTGTLANIPFFAELDSNIIIFLAPNQDILDKISNFYYELLYLFFYQQKIDWIYKQSRIIKQRLESEDFFPPPAAIPEIQLNSDLNLDTASLQELKKALLTNQIGLDKHTRGIEALAVQLQSLKTNLNSYEKRLQVIQNQASEIGKTDLKLLADFQNIIAPRYLNQIERDYASLSPGLKVREQYINTIRGLVEISQAERDRRSETQNRHFQNKVAYIGVGLGTASVTASSVANFAEEIREYPPFSYRAIIPLPAPWLNFSVALTIRRKARVRATRGNLVKFCK
ncbi:MAG: hypothetical protein SAL07_25300, partial [Oscillatoria sp. PMC 1051.18]|nr:hypothetical protein [Oscillatoria sp. PMC 1050.18]MEC5033224.1 hypothetical protein [Oscillatoria sp. PMC 1051.18]